MFCNKCGSKLIGDEENCPYCGEPVEAHSVEENVVSKRLSILEDQKNNPLSATSEHLEPNFSNLKDEKPEDNGSFWYGVLGFFIPLAGLILFCVWKNEKPKSAKQAGIGALIQTVLSVVIVFPCICCCVMLGTSS